MKPPPPCPVCRGDGVEPAKDGGWDACGRCARVAEADWRARQRVRVCEAA
ncbi:MAG: hypothetical protein RLZZ187_2583 [Pseudomonadota bacterium]|jgi:hypothetical protein